MHICKCVVDRIYAKDPEYIERISKQFPDFPHNVFISIMANEFLKRYISPEIGMLPLSLAKTMEDSQVCIFKAKDSFFITSTMPVMNIYGEKNGIEYDLIGMPIAPDFFLAFVDVDTCLPKVVTVDAYSVKRINGRHVGGAGKVLISNRVDLLSHIDFLFECEEYDDLELYQMLHTDKESALNQYEEIINSKEIKYWR